MNFSTNRILLSRLLCFFLSLGSVALQSCDKALDLTNSNSNTNLGNGSTQSPPTVTAPSTTFISSEDYSATGNGAWWLQSFTVSASARFVLRFASTYAAQAAVITPDQVNNFKNNAGFSGNGLDKQIGTVYMTLSPGTYYVGVRNSVSSANTWTVEFDYDISLPSSDRCSFADIYVQGSKSAPNGGKLWQPFTIQSGFRYFLDGCNVGFKTYIIAADQINAFTGGQSFYSFSDYDDSGGKAPGIYEVKLPPGDYFLACTAAGPAALTYTMERWKVN